MSRYVAIVGVLLVVLVVGIGSVQPTLSREPVPQNPDLAPLLEQARNEGEIRVIVRLNAEVQPEAGLSQADVAEQRQAIAQTRTRLLQHLSAHGVTNNVTVNRSYHTLPALALTVDDEALLVLSTVPEVRAIAEDIEFSATLDSSIPVIGANNAWNAGYTGSGYAVAILDTGVETAHPFLGGRVVSEACYSSNVGTPPSEPYARSACPGGVEESVAIGSAAPCSGDGCDHGTHVAGIAAGQRYAGMSSPFDGVAKDAGIIAIQVFSLKYDESGCSRAGKTSPCTTAYFSDMVKGLEHIYDLRTTYTIASVNMSISGGQYFTEATCDDNTWGNLFKEATANLNSANIAVIASSGNNEYTSSMGMPACVSNIVSVGATNDGDNVTSFSNSATFLDLLAPGYGINSSVTGYAYGYKNGTSMAAPHVAGAWAVLRQADPLATVNDILSALSRTGVAVFDTRNSITRPRIQLDAAVNALNPVSYGIEVTPPSPDARSALQGTTVKYTFGLKNTGTVQTTYAVSLSDNQWTTRVSATPITLEAGRVQQVDIEVDIPASAAANVSDVVNVVVSAQEDPTTSSNFSLTTTSLGPPPSGDCNADGSLGAADFTAMMLRIFNGEYGNNASCDANEDGSVNAADFTCTVLLMGQQSCEGTITAEPSSSPTLEPMVASATVHQDTVTIPIIFSQGSSNISSIVFSLNYDETRLSFDATDENNDGTPDAVVFSIPPSFTKNVIFDAQDRRGELKMLIADHSAPLSTLTGGVIATVTLQMTDSTDTLDETLIQTGTMPQLSFGNSQGQAVPTESTQQGSLVFLPLISR